MVSAVFSVADVQVASLVAISTSSTTDSYFWLFGRKICLPLRGLVAGFPLWFLVYVWGVRPACMLYILYSWRGVALHSLRRWLLLLFCHGHTHKFGVLLHISGILVYGTRCQPIILRLLDSSRTFFFAYLSSCFFFVLTLGGVGLTRVVHESWRTSSGWL